MAEKRGLFITFEGIEGSGKSTQISLLAKRLRESGFSVVENREPGCTAIGKQIRHILLTPENNEMDSMTELFLMFASRTQAAAEVIRPALERGHIVISDRFTDSSLAYQGEARGLGFETVLAAHKLALGSLLPDLTLWLDIDISTGLERAHQRNDAAAGGNSEARLDELSIDFHRRVQRGYERIAALYPERVRTIRADGPLSEIAGRIWNEVEVVLPSAAHKRQNR